MNTNETKILEKVRKSGLISKNSTIIAGVSGGPDSLTLLHVLLELSEEANLHIIPVHVNHGLRENADYEERHLTDICADWGVSCVVKRIDCCRIARQKKCSLEEAGREERYRIFSEVAKEAQESGVPKDRIYIAVAHNADDQCETVLQRIVRGTGIHGLRGIPFTREDEQGFTIIRPLLSVKRKEIESYVQDQGLIPNYDETNQETEYTRNRIRLELIPYLEKNLNPGVRESLRNLSEIATMEDDYMEQETERYFHEAQWEGANVLDVTKVRALHPAMEYRVVDRFLKQAVKADAIRKNILDSAVKLVRSENPSARMNLPGGHVLKRQYNQLILEQMGWNSANSGDGAAEQETAALPKGSILIAEIRRAEDWKKKDVFESLRAYRQSGRMVALLDYDAIRQDLGECLNLVVLRYRMPGDRISIADGKHKKLQNYMVDAKIPREQRENVQLVAVGAEVLWILPSMLLPNKIEREFGRISQKYQIREGSNAVLFLEIK